MALAEASYPARARSAGPKGWRTTAKTLLQEPLLHFLLLGGVIFALGDYRAQSQQQSRIEVTRDDVAHIAQTYRQQFGGAPSATTLRALVNRTIEEEIYYREGLANGLDRDDQVIRRRVVQKMQFLEQDLNAPSEPSASDLRKYYAAHPQRYTVPARLSFTHIYFSPDKGGDAAAKARAQAVLSQLTPAISRAPERGDAYSDLYDYASIDAAAAARLFGDTPIAKALFAAPEGQWAGPFRSGYGWHLVYVGAKTPAHLLPFAAVRDTVRTDVLADAQAAANRAAFAELKARYTIANTSGVK